MWILLLSISVFAQGALAEVDCSKDSFEQCETPAIFSFVPTDVLEFNRLCPEAPAYIRCLTNIEDQCGTGSSHLLEYKKEYDGMHDVFSDVCEEGTFLNRVATENLRCFNQTLRTTSCPEKIKAVTGPYRSPGEGTDYTLPIEINCLQDILESDCIAADIGENCGQDALKATLEFFSRSFYVEDTCGKKTAKILLRNLDEYNLNQEQKALVIVTLEKFIISAKK